MCAGNDIRLRFPKENIAIGIAVIAIGCMLFSGCVWSNKSREYAEARYQDGKQETAAIYERRIVGLKAECDKRVADSETFGWNWAKNYTRGQIVIDLTDAIKKYPKSAVFLGKIRDRYK